MSGKNSKKLRRKLFRKLAPELKTYVIDRWLPGRIWLAVKIIFKSRDW